MCEARLANPENNQLYIYFSYASYTDCDIFSNIL